MPGVKLMGLPNPWPFGLAEDVTASTGEASAPRVDSGSLIVTCQE